MDWEFWDELSVGVFSDEMPVAGPGSSGSSLHLFGFLGWLWVGDIPILPAVFCGDSLQQSFAFPRVEPNCMDGATYLRPIEFIFLPIRLEEIAGYIRASHPVSE